MHKSQQHGGEEREKGLETYQLTVIMYHVITNVEDQEKWRKQVGDTNLKTGYWDNMSCSHGKTKMRGGETGEVGREDSHMFYTYSFKLFQIISLCFHLWRAYACEA